MLLQRIGCLFGVVCTFYKQNILKHVSHLPGAFAVSRTLSSLSQIGLEKVDGGEAEGIFEKEWDNLIILDACRYDYYSDVFGDVGSRISRGSATPEFIMENFQEGDFSDIILVTANPQFSDGKFREYAGRDRDDVFFMVYDLFDTEWDDDFGTVLPADVVRHAKSAEKLYPDKRKIIHFMQPHGPLVFERDGELGTVGVSDIVDGSISAEGYRERYRESIEYLGQFIEELAQGLSGTTVVTADHGELLAENNNMDMHPFYLDTRVLREVPWHVISD